jgi:hypothetical protein
MNENEVTPKIGTTCPALTNENYEYHLSGDAYNKFNKCMLNGRTCVGVRVTDPEDASNRFFSRGKAHIDMDDIKKCPVYGSSKEVIELIVKEKAKKELEDKLNQLK